MITDAHKNLNIDSLHQTWSRCISYIGENFSAGSWPYMPGGAPSTEATAWAMLAVRGAPSRPNKTDAAARWFIDKQNQDGGWSTGPGMGKSDWTSGPALLALRLAASQDSAPIENSTRAALKPAISRALRYMFDSRKEFYGSLARFLLFLGKGTSGLDYARGWPWTPDCYHWIEPTVYALLSLKLPQRIHSDVYDEIIYHAEEFIRENECRGGGWNHGNMYCLKCFLPPFIVTTGEALLALQEAPESGGVKAAIKFLLQVEPTECSALEHAWSILALDAHGQPTDKLVASLAAHQNHDGSFGLNMMATALGCLALETAVCKKNPLKIISQSEEHQ